MQIVVLTGLAGAGKTEALRSLEDLGFYCVDNLPIPLVRGFVDLLAQSGEAWRAALVIDARAGEFLEGFAKLGAELREAGHTVDTLFLDADTEILVRRFSETRRRHPLDDEDLGEGIRKERLLLSELRREATQVVDTSNLTPHDLRRFMRQHYAGRQQFPALMLLSFGFKYGLPAQADLVLDVRFITNPFFVEELRALTGTDREVADFVLQQEDTETFLEHITGLLRMLLPLYRREGKAYLTAAFGCTGGQHRSVAIVEELKRRLSKDHAQIAIRHRDITHSQ